MKPLKVFRPTLDDVEKLSHGKATRKRIGSRHVCHRLNRNERKLYEIAKLAGYLSVSGSSYRKERKGSPVKNIFRQRCDALEKLCIVIEKRTAQDRLLVDFSTLRVEDDSAFIEIIFQQVIKAKYPEFMEETQILCEKQKLDWNSVLCDPIWNIDDRLFVINCDRHIAKSIATDILKLSEEFDTTVYVKNESNMKVVQEPDEYHDNNSSDTQTIKAIDTVNQCDDDDIDWSDI